MKKISALLLSLVLLLSLCACGSGTRGASSANEAAYDTVAFEMPEEDYGYGGFASYEAAEAEFADGGTGVDVPAMDPEKIIYSASATVETTDFDSTLQRLQTLVAQYGGFVESSSVNGSNYYSQARGYGSTRSASYTLRVPSASFAELMGSLSTLGNVPYSHTYSENITAQYYDVSARLTAYRTQEARLLEMMEKAETVKDVITIEDRLTELRYQIESLQSTVNNWDRQVSYSSIGLEIREVEVYTPEATLSYGQQLYLALTNGLKSTGNFFKELLIDLLEALPVLIILGVIIFVAVRILKSRQRKRQEKRAVEQAKKAAEQAERKESGK